MKKKLIIAVLALLPLAAVAQNNPYLSDFLQSKETGKAYRSLIARYQLPSWVKEGGTSTPASKISIEGIPYLALSGCMPHNCATQAISILYSPEKGDISGVFSELDTATGRQTLTWLDPEASYDTVKRNILFSRLNGDVPGVK